MHLVPRPNGSRSTSGLRMGKDSVELIMRDRVRTQYAAQSLMTGTDFRDGSTHCPPLTLDQAADILQWSRNYRVM